MSRLVLCNPNMQIGFEGLLLGLKKVGWSVILDKKNTPEFADGVNGKFSRLSSLTGRNALWMPSYHELEEICMAHKIRHIHVLGEPTYLSTFVCAKLKERGVIKTLSCRVAQNMKHKLPPPFKCSTKKSVEQLDLIFPVTRFSGQYAENVFAGVRQVVLPNGIPEPFLEEAGVIKGAAESPRVLFAGSFLKRKGLDDLICVAKMLECEGVQFDLVGGSVKELEKIYQGSLPANVHISGSVTHAELLRYYRSSTVFALLSKTTNGKDFGIFSRFMPVPSAEQFGRVVIEAHSQGVPVVAYDTGGLPDVVFDKEFICPEGDVNCVAEKIREAISRQGRDAENLISYGRKFSWMDIAGQLDNEVDCI
ncbi:glycosyltransferase family 4 protein [Alphaproteobacteria bacterium]|nr:glycosyltransferase family 4 protein [Alphaproteobacteria bacterium]